MLIPSWGCSKVIYFRGVISGESGAFMNGISECPVRAGLQASSISLYHERIQRENDTLKPRRQPSQNLPLPPHWSQILASRTLRNKCNCLSLQFMVFCCNSWNRQMDRAATKIFPHRPFLPPQKISWGPVPKRVITWSKGSDFFFFPYWEPNPGPQACWTTALSCTTAPTLIFLTAR